jgi:hypothetical protein
MRGNFKKTKSGVEMNSSEITRELELIHLKLKMGVVSAQQAKNESDILRVALQAHEQFTLEEKLDRLENLLSSER